MKHTYLRILCLLLALLLAMSLCACGGGNEDPNHFDFGKYELVYKGACIMYNESGEDALVLTFDFTNNSKEDASYGWTIYEKAMQDGVEMESTYVITDLETYSGVSDNYFKSIEPGKTIEVSTPYKLNGMSEVKITLSDLLDHHSYTITVDPATLSRVENEYSDWDWDLEDMDDSEPEEPEETLSYVDWWEGDWYGWWIISSSSGSYEDYSGYWWDVCARIEVDDDQSGEIVIWDDEDRSSASPCCVAQISFNEAGTGEHGTMMSESGAFMDQVLQHADWIVDPGLEKVDDLIWINGTYDGDEGSYSYKIYLRPWGVTWDDITEDVLKYEDPHPKSYDWYLSFINAGQPMPDSFDETVSGGASNSGAVDEPGVDNTAAATGNMVPFTVDGKTMDDVPFTLTFSLPEGFWDMETYMFAYDFKIYNCPDGDDVPWDTPFIWIRYYDNETKLNFDVPNYENLSETEGRTIGGVEMQGRKYDRFGYEQMQEYYGVLSNGIGVSIRLVKTPDSLLPECYNILDTVRFN